jgi:quercetin dioxygenase-like cupin family protein
MTRMMARATMVAVAAAFGMVTGAAAADEPKVTPLMTRELVGTPGKEATMITVEYAPGGSSAEHRHDAHTFVYVLEGSVVMQVRGGKEVTLGPGQTFYESPDDVHSVSRNASTTKPARCLVFFVKEKDKPLSTPVR